MNEAVRNFCNNFAEKLIFQREIEYSCYQFVDKLGSQRAQTSPHCAGLRSGIGTTSVIQIIDNSISFHDLMIGSQQHALEIMHYQVLTLFHVYDYAYARMKQDARYEFRRKYQS